MLDADERIDADLRTSILEANPDSTINGYQVRRTTWLCGKPVRGCGWENEPLLRLFRTSSARLVAHPAAGGDADLHEGWEVDGIAPMLRGHLQHDSYPTVQSYHEKFARYTSIEGASMNASALDLARNVLVAPLRALWLYLGRAGIAGGWRGAFVAVYTALYPVVASYKSITRRHSR